MNCTQKDLKEHDKLQEYFGWVGNAIFIFAQLFQIVHTYRIKKTDDLSYGLEILWMVGNTMYTLFGIFDRSFSMFLGSFITLITSIIQFGQKVYYDRMNSKIALPYYEQVL